MNEATYRAKSDLVAVGSMTSRSVVGSRPPSLARPLPARIRKSTVRFMKFVYGVILRHHPEGIRKGDMESFLLESEVGRLRHAMKVLVGCGLVKRKPFINDTRETVYVAVNPSVSFCASDSCKNLVVIPEGSPPSSRYCDDCRSLEELGKAK